MKLLDVVEVLHDLPEEVAKGQVGTVVEELDSNTVLVEFADRNGIALAIFPIPRASLRRLRSRTQDLHAWAIEQARLLRAGCFDRLDVEGIADAIEEVALREQRELADGLVVLLAQLLLGAKRPARRGAGWEKTITAQRKEIHYALVASPSLAPKLKEARWVGVVWARAVALVGNETGLPGLPERCPWTIQDEVLKVTWWP